MGLFRELKYAWNRKYYHYKAKLRLATQDKAKDLQNLAPEEIARKHEKRKMKIKK